MTCMATVNLIATVLILRVYYRNPALPVPRLLSTLAAEPTLHASEENAWQRIAKKLDLCIFVVCFIFVSLSTVVFIGLMLA